MADGCWRKGDVRPGRVFTKGKVAWPSPILSLGSSAELRIDRGLKAPTRASSPQWNGFCLFGSTMRLSGGWGWGP